MKLLERLNPEVGLHISWFFLAFGCMVIGLSQDFIPLWALGCISMGVLSVRCFAKAVGWVMKEARKPKEEMVTVYSGGKLYQVTRAAFNDPNFTFPGAGPATPAGSWPAPPKAKAKPTNNPAIDNLPLRQDVILGYRKYSIHWIDGHIALRGSFGGIWTERKMRASCGSLKGGLEEAARLCETHLAILDCQCGIYAYAEPQGLRTGEVSARVVGYGIVWPHTQGWRASEARIEELNYHPQSRSPYEKEIVKALEEQFGVPVRTPQPTLWDREDEPVNDPYFLPGVPGVVQRAGPSYASFWTSGG